MQRRHRRAHRRIWLLLAVLLPVALLGAVLMRQGGPAPEPVRLAQ